MKKVIAVVLTMVALLALVIGQSNRIKSLNAEVETLQFNNETLLEGVKVWRTKDSLSVAEVSALNLKLKDYERFFEEDAKVIASLKSRNSELEDVATSQMQTIAELRLIPCDTVVIIDSVVTPMKVVSYHDAWYDFEGMFNDTSFVGKMSSRDSLLLYHTVQYRKFLWWKRKKGETFNLVSKNPHSEILGFEHIKITE